MKKSVLGGRGKLTDTTIQNLGRYFNKAIRDSKRGTVEEMRRACMSGFMHVSSSNENPKHEYCPSGEDSWCFYNKAESLDQQPPSHETMKFKMLLNDDERNRVQGVYKSLKKNQVKGHCLKGRTQNTNESVHSKIWNKKRKTKFRGVLSLQHAARTTVAEHNFSFEQANVIAQMPFNKPSEQQQQADRFREASKNRMALKSRASGRKRSRSIVQEEDPDYGAGRH